IKSEGGTTFVQEPATAKYDGMPVSAIAAGQADFVLPPERIAEKLSENEEGSPGVPLQKIFDLLRRRTNVDLSGYKLTTVNRRIERRMAATGAKNIEDY